MKKISVLLFTLLIAVMMATVPVASHAYLIFFGEDPNNSESTPLTLIPNSSTAETNFLSNLVGVGTEDFEGIAAGTSAPVPLTFPGAGTATLSGGNGIVVNVPSGNASAGRYSIPSASSINFWEVRAGGLGNFQVGFSNPVAAFGFYGVDIGDFGGQFQLLLNDTGATTLTVPNTVGSGGSTGGSVLYYGFIAENANEVFSNVSFLTTGSSDVFAFDNFTIGSLEQVKPVPEPATILLLGFGLFGIAGLGRKRILKRS